MIPRTVVVALACLAAFVLPAATAEDESAGDISSVFNSLRGETFQWPERFAELKEELVPVGEAREQLLAAWDRLQQVLDPKLQQLVEQQHVRPHSSIPLCCARPALSSLVSKRSLHPRIVFENSSASLLCRSRV